MYENPIHLCFPFVMALKTPRMDLGLYCNHCSLPSGYGAGFANPDLLKRCGGCGVVKYCSQPHQKVDRPRHKVQCDPIKEQREKLTEEEAKLRANPGEDTNGVDPFTSIVGQFWFYKSTRPYMSARFDMMSAILNVRTGEAVEAALGHALEMLRLCRGDNQGVRSYVPALYLRLGSDQEAYEFIKWHATVPDDKYEWSNPDLPYLDLHDQDAFEPVFDEPRFYNVTFTVALTLIKIRLMKDLEFLQDFLQKNPDASGEARRAHLEEEAMSDILLKRTQNIAHNNYKELIAQLKSQIKQLYEKVKKDNTHFWPGVQNPMLYAYDVPIIYIPGSREEAVLIFRQSWYSWAETEPAITYIRGIISQDR
ncbi:hypothetical protein NW768_010703 [Fusarium equiseti]|uniref:MYND-type domain-containing protein n=1 Tax=Fusarium equiseti TaxID=61235 RepID=A0ABQ8R0F4_FUSEQ|nr:hypothetical protein NW768_010703 [Fusarium equiseti]